MFIIEFPWAMGYSHRVAYYFTYPKELAESLSFSDVVQIKLENTSVLRVFLKPKKCPDLPLVCNPQAHSVLLQGTGVVFLVLSHLQAKLRYGGGAETESQMQMNKSTVNLPEKQIQILYQERSVALECMHQGIKTSCSCFIYSNIFSSCEQLSLYF